MTRRLRLPNDRELKAIKDHGLHRAIVGDLLPSVENALNALDTAVQEDTASLEMVIQTLAGLLHAQADVRNVVVEVVELGGSTLNEDELYTALAKWIIDNQIGTGFDWDLSITPIRR